MTLRLKFQNLDVDLKCECNTTHERRSRVSVGVLSEKERLVLLGTDVEVELNDLSLI